MMLEHFMHCVRNDMNGRCFAEIGASLPLGSDALVLVFAPSPINWRGPFVGVPVCITSLEWTENKTPVAMENLARKRCAEAAREYRDRQLIYRPDEAA